MSETNPTGNPEVIRLKRRFPGLAEKRFSLPDAKRIGDALGINWCEFGVEQFLIRLQVELDNGKRDRQTNVTNEIMR